MWVTNWIFKKKSLVYGKNCRCSRGHTKSMGGLGDGISLEQLKPIGDHFHINEEL